MNKELSFYRAKFVGCYGAFNNNYNKDIQEAKSTMFKFKKNEMEQNKFNEFLSYSILHRITRRWPKVNSFLLSRWAKKTGFHYDEEIEKINEEIELEFFSVNECDIEQVHF